MVTVGGTAVIKKLDESVINRIAAGEVVQRPSAAVKELIENSIDAGATTITVSAKGGGLQLLQIQDNGRGIRRADMPIVCERFTTSKLSKFDDLKSIATFGFRGEALASISHVAHVTIQTKTADEPCAYKAKYSDGKLVPLRAGDRAEARPCAGLTGTTITVEDLFYNMQTRKQAFRNTREEYQRILDVMMKYSVRFGDAGVSFICKKQGQALPDLHTAVGDSTLDNIRTSFGAALARELLDLKFTYCSGSSESSSTAEHPQLRGGDQEQQQQQQQGPVVIVEGKISNGNYSAKKAVLIIFINNRLVECTSLRKAIDAVYSEILPRHMHPFVYLNIHMPPHHLDVNVHPTKKEVHFLHEDLLLEQLHRHVWELLRSANESRSFQVQTTLLPRPADAAAERSYSAHQSDRPARAVEEVEMADAQLAGSSNDRSDNNQQMNDREQRGIAGSTLGASIYSQPKQRTLRDEPFDFNAFSAAGTDLRLHPSLQPGKVDSSSNNGRGLSGNGSGNGGAGAPRAKSKSAAPNKLVRTDPSQLPIDAIFKSQSVVRSQAEERVRQFDGPNSAVDATDQCECPSPLLVSADQLTERDRMVIDADADTDASSGTGEAAPTPAAAADGDLTTDEQGLEANDAMAAPTPAAKKRKLSAIGSLSAMGCLCCGKFSAPSSAYAQVCAPAESNASATQQQQQQQLKELKITSCNYDSVQRLLEDFNVQRSPSIAQMLKKFSFVGAINSTFCLIQQGTKLLMVNHARLLRELFFQLTIKQFGEMGRMRFASPMDLRECLRAAVRVEDACGRLPARQLMAMSPPAQVEDAAAAQQPTEESRIRILNMVVERALDKLIENAEMLDEYFRINIDSDTVTLRGMPLLLSNYTPQADELPLFLLRLATEVQWDDEFACFHSVAAEIARFYAILPVKAPQRAHPTGAAAGDLPLLADDGVSTLRGHLLPAMRLYLSPPRRLERDHTVIQVAALEQLYKVFERC